MSNQSLADKYYVPAPRYTSYPTVPYWQTEPPSEEDWIKSVKHSFQLSNQTEGISLYVHLPFCESLCTYCGCNTRITKNHNVEKPYIEALLKEWEMYCSMLPEKPHIKEIHLGGGTPTFFSHENLHWLISGLLEKATIHEKAEFSFEGHPNNTTKEHLATLFDLGFRRMSLGIQDFDRRVQFIINRMQSYEQVQLVTEQAREIGYTSINYDLIYGLPLQTLEGMDVTIRKATSLLPDRIAFYSYAHVPWVKPGQRRFTEEHLPSVELKQQLYERGRELFISGGYDEIGMDHFALKSDSLYTAWSSGRLHRNFMGYTHQYTKLMIGLGVSSISDTWFAFAQNVKKVEEYIALVEQERFPIFKGHLLNDEDLVIRYHILNLMCSGNTSWDPGSELHQALASGLVRMKEMQNDGLIEIGENSIQVTPRGKRFLRNICMALDARLYANQPTTPLFSMAG